jgi:hypothetical protein
MMPLYVTIIITTLYHWSTIINATTYSVETTYGVDSVMSKLMAFVEGAGTGQFLFLVVLVLSCFTCSWHHPFLSYDVITNFFEWEPPLFSVSGGPFCYLSDEWEKLVSCMTVFLRKWQVLLREFDLIFNVKILIDPKQKQTNI